MKASYPLLTFIIFTPLLGAVLVGLVPPRRQDVCRALGITMSAVTFGLTVLLVVKFRRGVAGYQFVESHTWIKSLGIGYRLGVDGISLFMVALTGLLFPLSLIASEGVRKRVKHYTMFMLTLETGVLGVFLATDLFLFFVFWEAMLVPMYFIIGGWGGERRVYAAVKFFLFTAAGSAFLLAAILALGLLTQPVSFDLARVSQTELSMVAQRVLFWGFTISFLVKVPVFPLHTWLPDAHTEAPTAGSVILAGVLLKLGAYGLLRFSLPLFPRAAVESVPVLLTLAVIGIVYGALVAIRQKDAKRLVAYTSVSHLGFIVLGIFALTTTGIQGGVIQMVNHGLTTGALFLLIGFVYERRHTREISEFGGLKAQMPVYAGLFLFVALASAGLPGLNGFVGEMLTLFGTFVVHRPWAIVAATGVILAAIYLLWLYQRMFHGPLDNPANATLSDLRPTEVFVLAPIVVLILFLGIYPKPVLDRIEPSAAKIVKAVERGSKFREPRSTRPGGKAGGSVSVSLYDWSYTGSDGKESSGTVLIEEDHE